MGLPRFARNDIPLCRCEAGKASRSNPGPVMRLPRFARNDIGDTSPAITRGLFSGYVPSGNQVMLERFLPGPHVIQAQEPQVVIVQHGVAGPYGFLGIPV